MAGFDFCLKNAHLEDQAGVVFGLREIGILDGRIAALKVEIYLFLIFTLDIQIGPCLYFSHLIVS